MQWQDIVDEEERHADLRAAIESANFLIHIQYLEVESDYKLWGQMPPLKTQKMENQIQTKEVTLEVLPLKQLRISVANSTKQMRNIVDIVYHSNPSGASVLAKSMAEYIQSIHEGLPTLLNKPDLFTQLKQAHNNE